MGYYYTAEICLNGHCSTDSVEVSPETREKYCSNCGTNTITACQYCKTNIRGYYREDRIKYALPYIPPKYCHYCGKPYPWTERALEAAKELIMMSDINETEKNDLINELPNVVIDTPRTNIIAVKFSKFIKAAGPAIGSAFKDIILAVSKLFSAIKKD